MQHWQLMPSLDRSAATRCWISVAAAMRPATSARRTGIVSKVVVMHRTVSGLRWMPTLQAGRLVICSQALRDAESRCRTMEA